MKKASKDRSIFRWKILGVIPVILAILVVVLLVKSKSGPEKKELQESSRVMRVITVPKVDLIPRTVGYGTAEPGQVWRAVAEVRGRVVEVHPHLQAGALLKENDLLLKIDSNEYELKVAVLQADIAQVAAELSELTVQEENTRSSLEIEKRSRLLAEQTLQRKQRSLRDKAISPNEVDQEERNTLIQQQRVQELENSLSLMPSRRKALEAKMDSNKAALEQAQADLAKTEIRAPFACRISAVSIESGQYLAAGQVLFEAHGTAVSEIEAQILGEHLRHLIGLQDEAALGSTEYLTAMR